MMFSLSHWKTNRNSQPDETESLCNDLEVSDYETFLPQFGVEVNETILFKTRWPKWQSFCKLFRQSRSIRSFSLTLTSLWKVHKFVERLYLSSLVGNMYTLRKHVNTHCIFVKRQSREEKRNCKRNVQSNSQFWRCWEKTAKTQVNRVIWTALNKGRLFRSRPAWVPTVTSPSHCGQMKPHQLG